MQNPQLVLSWTNPDFRLQAAPEATGNYTNVPNATSPYTNSLTGPRRFFRLAAPLTDQSDLLLLTVTFNR